MKKNTENEPADRRQLKKWLSQRKITQKKLAEISECEPRRAIRRLRGLEAFSKKDALTLCRRFGLSADFILGLSDRAFISGRAGRAEKNSPPAGSIEPRSFFARAQKKFSAAAKILF